MILATGGLSYPATGSTGDGYTMAKALGHTIVPPRPALVPLETVGIVSGPSAGRVPRGRRGDGDERPEEDRLGIGGPAFHPLTASPAPSFSR